MTRQLDANPADPWNELRVWNTEVGALVTADLQAENNPMSRQFRTWAVTDRVLVAQHRAALKGRAA